MAVELRHSDLDDPFAGSSVLSLLPRTFEAVPHAEAPASEAQELDSIRTVLSSMVLKGSTLVPTQEISMTCQSTLNSSRNGDERVAGKAQDCPQGRRPALGRKRAQFSLKPVSRDSVLNSDLSSQIDHIEDPEEYFSIFEQLENADKELKKLRGEVSSDPRQQHQPTMARKHRPSILGKTATYKHLFTATADTAEAFRVSQEVIHDRSTNSPSKSFVIPKSSDAFPAKEVDTEVAISQASKVDGELLESTENEGFIADKGNVSSLLDKLLSSFKDLDESQGAALLRESLQIKSIDVGKINLPELHTFQRNALRALDYGATVSKSARCQLLQASPTPTRSPLSAISKLRRLFPLKDPLNDPYMLPSSDDACFGYSYGSKCHDKRSLTPPVSVPFFEFDKTNGASIETEDEATEHSHISPENTTEHRYNHANDDINDSDKPNSHMEEQGNDMQVEEAISEHPESILEDPHSSYAGYTGTENVGTHCEDEAEDPSIFSVEVQVHASLHCDDGTLHNEVTVMAHEELTLCVESHKDLEMDGQSAETSTLPAENNETQECLVTSTLSKHKEKKKNTRIGQSRQKLNSKRQSLAAFGMKWESGVRRSTRIKSRPLQYWRGERFIYGRLHDSMATVIGMKIESPGKDGKEPVLKVKSFVSEKHADLVAQAGQY